MYRRFALIAGVVLGLLLLVVTEARGSGVLNAPLAASPLGTAFTYQGQLKQGGTAVTASCDMQLSLFDSASPTVQIGSTQTKTGVNVSNGLFTIPDLDFGNVFNGDARWLQIAVRCPSGSGSFSTLSPLVALAPAPYALYSTSAGSATTATTATTATNFTGPLVGDVTGTQGATTVARLQGQTVAATVPTANQVLQFSGGQWAPATVAGGSSGLSAYAYIYNQGAQVVALEADVSFDTNGVLAGGITHTAGTSTITVPTSGDYKIAFTVAAVEPNQFTVYQNGAPIAGATFGSGAGTQPSTGQVIVTMAAGDVLTLRNHTSSAAVTLQTLAGGTQTNVNASILIEKLN